MRWWWWMIITNSGIIAVVRFMAPFLPTYPCLQSAPFVDEWLMRCCCQYYWCHPSALQLQVYSPHRYKNYVRTRWETTAEQLEWDPSELTFKWNQFGFSSLIIVFKLSLLEKYRLIQWTNEPLINDVKNRERTPRPTLVGEKSEMWV